MEKVGFDGMVRPLEEADIPALRKISEYWLQDDGIVAYDEVEHDTQTLIESLKEGSSKRIFVAATPSGQAIGMMGLSFRPKSDLLPFAKTSNPSELIIAYVDPNFNHGKGVGTMLINAVQDLARSLGKKEILLESGPRHKETGYPFYDKQPGFQRVGQIDDFYGPGADTVVWQKTF